MVDASVAGAWFFPDEISPYSEGVLERLRHEGAIVPGIWALEVLNILLVGERRGRLTEARTAQSFRLLTQLPIEIVGGMDSQKQHAVLTLGRTHGLTSYDAAYLELALHEQLPLATQDQQLLRAARQVGVQVVS